MSTQTEFPSGDLASIMRRFTDPTRKQLADLIAIWNYRGDGTATGDRNFRLNSGMTEAEIENMHWDTIATNGRVILVARRQKLDGANERGSFSPPAEWFWCWSQIEDGEDVSPASQEEIESVPQDVRKSLADVPGLKFMSIRQVNFWDHGPGKPKKKHRPSPNGMLFFSFTGGVGAAIATRKEESK